MVFTVFGSKFFEFSDYRVAELTTAFGRQTLHYMQHITKEVYGFKVISGDTDSIFITDTHRESNIKKFLAECSLLLEDIDIEISKIYRRLILLKKKHYIGIHLLSHAKYLDMLKSTFEEQLKVMGYDFVKDVMGVKSLATIPKR